MAVGRKPVHSRESFVAAALQLADKRGIGAVTVRALGAEVGASATAIYRHFPTKEALISAVQEELLAQVGKAWVSDADPIESFVNLGRALRAVAQRHPTLGQVLLIAIPSDAGPNPMSSLIVALLEQLGVTGERLVVGYRQLETLAIGSAIFDFGGAPTHLSDRRQRMNTLGHPDFTRHLNNDQAVARINDQAFDATLRHVVRDLAQPHAD